MFCSNVRYAVRSTISGSFVQRRCDRHYRVSLPSERRVRDIWSVVGSRQVNTATRLGVSKSTSTGTEGFQPFNLINTVTTHREHLAPETVNPHGAR